MSSSLHFWIHCGQCTGILPPIKPASKTQRSQQSSLNGACARKLQIITSIVSSGFLTRYSAEMIETSVKPMEEVHPSNPKSSSNKRKRPASSTPTKGNVVDLTEDGDDQAVSASPNRKKASPRKAQDVEKRLRKFRHYAPQTYLEKLHRATTQR